MFLTHLYTPFASHPHFLYTLSIKMWNYSKIKVLAKSRMLDSNFSMNAKNKNLQSNPVLRDGLKSRGQRVRDDVVNAKYHFSESTGKVLERSRNMFSTFSCEIGKD